MRLRVPRNSSSWLAVIVLASGCGSDSSSKIRLSSGAIGSDGVVQGGRSVLRVAAQEERTIAILNFENGTSEPNLEWLRRGLTDMLATELKQSPTLDVLTPARLDQLLEGTGRTSVDIIGDATAERIARDASVQTILTGRYYRDETNLVIDAELRDIATGETLRRETVSGPGLEKIFNMVSDLSRRVRDDLRVLEAPVAQADAARGIAGMTESVEAFKHYSRGLANQEKVLWGEAVDEFGAAIEADPEFAAAHLRRAAALASVGERQASRASIVRAREHADKLTAADEILLRLWEAEFDGDVDRMRAVRDELRRTAPHDMAARLVVARSLYGMGEYERAREELELIVEKDPASRLAYNLLGYLYADRGDFKTAIDYLETYRDLTPDEPNAHDSLGEVLVISGRLEEAIEHFERALARWPDFHNSAMRLSQVYAELDDLERSLEYSQRWIDSAPSGKVKAEAYMSRAATLWRFDELGRAEEALELAREARPDAPWADWMRAEMHLARGEEAEASEIHRACFEQHRDVAAGSEWDSQRVLGFLNFCLSADIPPTELLPVAETAVATESAKMFRDLFQLYHGVLHLRAGEPEAARTCLSDKSGAHGLEGLVIARQMDRSYVWKYLVEAIELEPLSDPPDYRISAKVADAASRSGRDDLEVLARLLKVQYDAKYRRTEQVARGYRDLGIPSEQTWSVIGPFPNRGGFVRPFPPERAVDLDATYPVAGRTLAWKNADDGIVDGYLDLGVALGAKYWAVGYGVIDVHSPDERVAQIRLGSEQPVKLWVNDEMVWQAMPIKDSGLDHDIVQVMLHAGTNRILVKATSDVKDWGFYLRVTDDRGRGFPDLEFLPAGAARSALRATDGPSSRG